VRQSFFHNDPRSFKNVGGGVLGCKGLHSSFRTTQSGLSLNIGLILRPFLLYSHLNNNFSQFFFFNLFRCVNNYDCPTWACS